jgi:ABC-type uncharacterized transport system ATPase component
MDLNTTQILSDASKKYHRLVIVLGLPSTGKTKRLNKFKEHLNTVYINLNLALSEKLLNYSSNEQQYNVEELVNLIIDQHPTKVLLIDNTEIMFDPNLNLDVLNLFKRISRHQTCIITWTGSISDGKLRFSEAGYWGSKTSYDIGDIEII